MFYCSVWWYTISWSQNCRMPSWNAWGNFLLALIQDCWKNTKFTTESQLVGRFQCFRYSVIYLDNGKVKYIILESVCVVFMNKTSYHPLAILRQGGGGQNSRSTVNFKVIYDNNNTSLSWNSGWRYIQFLILFSRFFNVKKPNKKKRFLINKAWNKHDYLILFKILCKWFKVI